MLWSVMYTWMFLLSWCACEVWMNFELDILKEFVLNCLFHVLQDHALAPAWLFLKMLCPAQWVLWAGSTGKNALNCSRNSPDNWIGLDSACSWSPPLVLPQYMAVRNSQTAEDTSGNCCYAHPMLTWLEWCFSCTFNFHHVPAIQWSGASCGEQ